NPNGARHTCPLDHHRPQDKRFRSTNSGRHGSCTNGVVTSLAAAVSACCDRERLEGSPGWSCADAHVLSRAFHANAPLPPRRPPKIRPVQEVAACGGLRQAGRPGGYLLSI